MPVKKRPATPQEKAAPNDATLAAAIVATFDRVAGDDLNAKKPTPAPWLKPDPHYPLPPPPLVWDPTVAKLKKGRPTLFEAKPESWPRLVWALRQGNTLSTAAMFAGIARPTFHKLLQRGLEARKAGEVGPWQDFIDTIDRCLAEAEARHVDNIAFAGSIPKYWKASAHLLATRNPKKWAPAQRVAHTKADFKEDAVFEMVLPNTRPAATAQAHAAQARDQADGDLDDLDDLDDYEAGR